MHCENLQQKWQTEYSRLKLIKIITNYYSFSVDVDDEQKDDNAWAAAETTRDCCIFTCKECGKEYKSWSVLRKHISSKYIDGMGK